MFEQPYAGAAMDGRNIKCYDRDIVVFEVDQLVGNHCLIQVLIPLALFGFLFPGVRVIAVILLHVVTAQYAVYALASQAAEGMSFGLIPSMQHRVAAMETFGVFRNIGL